MTADDQDMSEALREDALWEDITKAIPRKRWAWSVFRDAQRWSISRDPIAHFSGNAMARAVKPFITKAETDMLPGLMIRADIAEDHASHLLRIILIANITLPVTLLLVVNQLVPDGFVGLLTDTLERSLFYAAFGGAFLTAGLFILHGLGGVRAFRNLKQLLLLEQVRRKAHLGHVRSDVSEPASEAANDLFKEASL